MQYDGVVNTEKDVFLWLLEGVNICNKIGHTTHTLISVFLSTCSTGAKYKITDN